MSIECEAHSKDSRIVIGWRARSFRVSHHPRHHVPLTDPTHLDRPPPKRRGRRREAQQLPDSAVFFVDILSMNMNDREVGVHTFSLFGLQTPCLGGGEGL